MFFVYISKSQKTCKYYTGSTKNTAERLLRHNSGKNKSTKSGVPWNLIYSEQFKTKNEAYKREIQIKSYKGGEAFKKLIKKIEL